MQSLFLMIRFLTRWPLPEQWARAEFNEENFVRGMKWLPLIGLLVGLPAALGLWLVFGLMDGGDAAILFGPFLAAALLILAGGSLHLDGLADTADALFANRPPEKALAVMRDSAVGTGGVIAIVLNILGKWVLLTGLLATTGDPAESVAALLAAPVCGRLALVWHAAAGRYARDEPGLGAFVNRVDHRQALAATCTASVLAAPLCLLPDCAVPLVLSLAAAIAIGTLFARFLAKKLGGITGDTLGATVELTEPVVFFLFLLHLA